jgi:hypothetical protein
MWLPILCILILTTPSYSFSMSPSLKPIPVLTVCELLAAREQYNGQIVAAVAVESSTDEGIWLIGGTCPVRVQTEDYVWPNSIALRYNPSKPTAIPEGFNIDDKELQSKLALVTQSQGGDRKKDLVLVVGQVQAEKLAVVRYDSGEIRGAGYGHLNGSPVALHYCERDYRLLTASTVK